MEEQQPQTMTLTLTGKQALAIGTRLIERQQVDKRDLSGRTPAYLEEMAAVDEVLKQMMHNLPPEPVRETIRRIFTV